MNGPSVTTPPRIEVAVSARLERQPGDDPPALLGDPAGQLPVGLHHLGRQLLGGHALEDQHRVLGHHATAFRV